MKLQNCHDNFWGEIKWFTHEIKKYFHLCFVKILIRASGRSREKKSNFAGFSGTNSRKKRPISQEFRGNFRGQFRRKRLVKNGQFRESISSRFRWKTIGFALIWGMFSMKLDAFIALLRLHTAIWNRTLQVSSLNIIKTIKESWY